MPWQLHLGHIDEPNTLIRASIKWINAVPVPVPVPSPRSWCRQPPPRWQKFNLPFTYTPLGPAACLHQLTGAEFSLKITINSPGIFHSLCRWLTCTCVCPAGLSQVIGLDRRANRYKLWCQLRPKLVSTRRQWPTPTTHTVEAEKIVFIDYNVLKSLKTFTGL